MFASRPLRVSSLRAQCGSTVVGVLIGLVLGLAVAVVAALMITRSPVPFVNKTGRVSERLEPPKPGAQMPDPNAPLYDKNRAELPADAQAQASAPAPAQDERMSILERLFGRSEPEPAAKPQAPAAADAPAAPDAPVTPGAPSAPDSPATSSASVVPNAPATQQGSTGDINSVRPPAAATTEQGVSYVLQAGAFRSRDDADSMRGKLALFGFEARVLSAAVNGQTVYRVRLGPYAQADEMNRMRARLAENGIETSVVRQR